MKCAFRMRTQEGIGGLMMSSRPGKSEQAAARGPRLDRRADEPLESGTGMLPGVRDEFGRPDTLLGNRAPLRRH